MNVIDKINQIFESLQNTDYAIFDGDKDIAHTLITENVLNIIECRNIIVKNALCSNIHEHIDESANRKNEQIVKYTIENAASSIDDLNKICKKLNIDAFADIDTKDLKTVSSYINDIAATLYNFGINK